MNVCLFRHFPIKSVGQSLSLLQHRSSGFHNLLVVHPRTRRSIRCLFGVDPPSVPALCSTLLSWGVYLSPPTESARDGARSHDSRLKRSVLYLLSYTSKKCRSFPTAMLLVGCITPMKKEVNQHHRWK